MVNIMVCLPCLMEVFDDRKKDRIIRPNFKFNMSLKWLEIR